MKYLKAQNSCKNDVMNIILTCYPISAPFVSETMVDDKDHRVAFTLRLEPSSYLRTRLSTTYEGNNHHGLTAGFPTDIIKRDPLLLKNASLTFFLA